MELRITQWQDYCLVKMKKMYKQNCKECGNYYEGQGRYFCSTKCSGKNKDRIKRQAKAMKGKPSWSKGLHIKFNDALAKWRKNGGIVWNKNKKLTKKQKLGLNMEGLKLGRGWNKGLKIPYDVWNKGKTKDDCPQLARSEKVKKQISKSLSGSNNYQWIFDRSLKEYPDEFNDELKEGIRIRDNYTCQLCYVKQKDYYRKLDIHHIDYDKNNCNDDNLITLCNGCNIRVNSNKDYWKDLFKKRMELHFAKKEIKL